jgi:fido (protein-threonine AMPylation protein)
MKSTNPLEEPYVRELHYRMFDNVWKWAGTYRQTERNIGCDPKEIVQ